MFLNQKEKRYIKSKLEELRGYKIVPVMSHIFFLNSVSWSRRFNSPVFIPASCHLKKTILLELNLNFDFLLLSLLLSDTFKWKKNIKRFLKFQVLDQIVPVKLVGTEMEFKEFEPRFKSAKTRFKLSAGVALILGKR